MDRSKRSLEEFTVSEDLINKFIETLNIFKKAGIKASDTTSTINGFQTKNILNYEVTKELSNEILKIINKDLYLFHIHLIEYFTNGEQLAHNHERTEDYSFILYLNDADGNTVFENIGEVKPKKGKLIFFNSDLMHYGKPSIKGKKIAVGALRIKE
jgi:hypothetical protein